MVSFGKPNSTKQQPSSVWSTQAPYLASLYGMGSQLAQGQGGIGQFAGDLSQNLLQGAGGYGSNATNPAIANLMQRAQGGSPWLQQQIGNLGTNISQNLNQQILPSLARYSTTAGGYGGGRMGVDMGQQAQYAQQQFQQGATNLYANDYNQGLGAALGAGQLGAQGVGQLGNMFNLGMSPYTSQWLPLQNLTNLIGGSTVLGGGASSGGGFNFSIGGGGDQLFANPVFGN